MADDRRSLRGPARGDDDERPPFAGSWRNVYLLVLGTLVALIALFSLASRVFR